MNFEEFVMKTSFDQDHMKNRNIRDQNPSEITENFMKRKKRLTFERSLR